MIVLHFNWKKLYRFFHLNNVYRYALKCGQVKGEGTPD